MSFDVLLSMTPTMWYAFDGAAACTMIWTFLRWLGTSRQQLRTTRFRGPPSESFIFGVGKRSFDAEKSGAKYEAWAREYGPVYEVPSTLGGAKIVLHDPKAIAHLFAKDTWTYTHTPFQKDSMAQSTGKSLLWADKDNHRRFLLPAFSIAAVRQMASILYDSAYKVKGAWDDLIALNGDNDTVIEVQNWMNRISLDTIGLVGFSHNFGSLEGKHTDVFECFATFSSSPRSSAINKDLLLLGEAFPSLVHIPTPRTRLRQKLSKALGEVSDELLARTQRELESGAVEGKEERSIIGSLIKGVDGNSGSLFTKDEVTAQMRLLLVAGYEATSAIMTWGLLELSRSPDVQTKLRIELLDHGADPTYDELDNNLPYLNAVVLETLRLHPAVLEVTRVAIEDDIIPLSKPIITKSGELVDRLMISKGTRVVIPMESINRSTAIWGEDAKLFRPSRWLVDAHGQNGIPATAKELQGHQHLLTFLDGPRICLGRRFALAEFRAVLTVLVKNFIFELRDGVDSKIEIGRALIPRPQMAGEVGCKLPLRVRPYIA